MQSPATIPGIALALAALAGPARADTHMVNIVNGASATMTSIVFSPPGTTSGSNRLRSTLPPSIAANFPYSAGCLIDIEVGYSDGRSEQKAGVDACANPRVVFGANPSVTTGAPSADAASHAAAPAGPAGTVTASSAAAAATAAFWATPAPPPAPAWDGHAITKRFGMDGWVSP